MTNYTPRCEIKDPRNIVYRILVHLVSPMVHLPQERTNKRDKVVLNEKMINGLRVCSCIFCLLIQVPVAMCVCVC